MERYRPQIEKEQNEKKKINSAVIGAFALRCTVNASAPYFYQDTDQGLYYIQNGESHWYSGRPITEQDHRNYASADAILQFHNAIGRREPTKLKHNVQTQHEVYDKAQEMIGRTGIVFPNKRITSFLSDLNIPRDELKTRIKNAKTVAEDVWNDRGTVPLEVFSVEDMTEALKEWPPKDAIPEDVGVTGDFMYETHKLPEVPTRIQTTPYYKSFYVIGESDKWLTSLIEDIYTLDARLKDK